MSAQPESRIDPSDLSAEQVTRMLEVVEGGGRPVLIGADGERIELPTALNDLFLSIIQAMHRKEAVFLMHENEAFTTQAAANFLGVSRQYLVRLLEDGQIPFHFVGTHRRVLFADLVAYQQARSEMRRAKLDAMTEELVEAGLYDRFVPLERSDAEA
jgi:excisionase family DNA binding protein